EIVGQLDQAIESMLAGSEPAAAGPGELAALMEIARALRDLPSEDFKNRLKAELQQKGAIKMSTSTVAGVRAGFRAITPFLIHSNAPELVEFLKTTFHAEELKRNTSAEASGFYSEVRIGDSVIMIAGGAAASRGNLPSALHVYVDDCDAAYRRALGAGAVTLMGAIGEPADRPYGERSAFVQDAFGNYWYIATRLASAPRPEGLGTVLPHVHPERARQYIDFLKRAFGADELTVVEQAGHVLHAAVRIGDAVLEMGEPADRTGIPFNGFFLFVEDVEAAYERALAAGAASVRAPADIPQGSRSAIVRDPEGYLWWPARAL
ncbi:MAG TPA: VOC family protein, partial [Bryobacteraceae bacterium]|nr:VOC family protein [Bryobacteraceae bacterium]